MHTKPCNKLKCNILHIVQLIYSEFNSLLPFMPDPEDIITGA